jgi:hypothetical protein
MTTKICGCTAETCGCCEGIQILTPQPTANRPGLSALNYRVGTHGAFLETMKARLTTMTVDVPAADGQTTETLLPLLDLTTRDSSDFSIALLDAWATVADVLTFYQERIADEGYLRTASERRSILELARLVGYTLRPGVAATVYLAYTIDEDRSVTPPKPIATTIPKGSRSQSVPGPDELPQSFETSDDLEARSEWNTLQPRMTRPQTKPSIKTSGLFLRGISTNLQPNDPLLIDFGKAGEAPTLLRVKQVVVDATNNRTQVTLQSWDDSQTQLPESESLESGDGLDTILRSLELPPSIPPPNALQLLRSPQATFTANADVFPRLLATMRPRLRETLYPALQNAVASASQPIKVYVLRVTASLFGANAPRQVLQTTPTVSTGEWPVVEIIPVIGLREDAVAPPPPTSRFKHEDPGIVWLDGSYEQIQPNSWLIVETEDTNLTTKGVLVAHAQDPKAGISRSDYGITAKSTQITLASAPGTADKAQWITADLETIIPVYGDVPADTADFQAIRRTVVYAQSEELALAEEPVQDDVCQGDTNWIELDSLYADLKSGRWAIVSGERADIKIPDPNDSTKQVSVAGIKASELVMLADVIQDVSTEDGEPSSKITSGKSDIQLPEEKRHTFIRFAKPLSYCYRRDTLIIYGNVVKTTHGETRNETLGNGDGSQSLQSFALKQPPLTFVSAPTPSGVDSTLEVFVNEVRWHEADMLGGLGPKDRKFITKTDDDGKTTVIFGNGEKGARLPTGMANVKSVYRNGIGKPGNVKAEQISLLQTRPLGVNSVLNPLPASGGADKENRDQARENAPLAVMSLDRLVSVQDYADFARTFAGIGKASATRLSDGRRQLVHVTIAGVDDIPIDATSDLYQNLLVALRGFGDPDLPVQVELRELIVLVLSANVRLATDYQWEPVVTKIRAALLDDFGFQKRAIGQPVLLSEIISAIQKIKGVAYVDVDAFGGVTEQLSLDGIAGAVQNIIKQPSPGSRVDVNLANFESGALHPAQLAIFTDAVPDTLILNQIK